MHPTLRDDPEMSHRSEVLIVSSLLLCLLGAGFSIQLAFLPKYQALAPVVSTTVVSSAITLLLLRFTARLQVATGILSVSIALALLRVCWLELGIQNISLIWFPLLAGAVAHIVSRQLAVMNAAFYASLVVLLFAFGPRVDDIPTLEGLVRSSAVLGGIVFATALAVRYESIRITTIALAKHVADEQEAVNKTLAIAKQEAEQANAAKTDFLSTMSHELRTPLNGILGSASLLLRSEPEAQQRELLKSIHVASEQLHAMIGDILDLSKIEAGHIIITDQPFSLQQLLDDVCDMTAPTARGKMLPLVVKLPASVPDSLRGDEIRLRQVLLNLVHNAIKFTDAGCIVIEVHPITVDDHSAQLRFEVTDTGIGLTHETKRRLFEPFAQGLGAYGGRGGTGLGLAICRRLVVAMGGTIDANSQPMEGSTFWFELRFSKAATRQAAHRNLVGRSAAIIESNKHIRTGLEHDLRAFGMHVSATHDPALLGDLRTFDIIITSPEVANAHGKLAGFSGLVLLMTPSNQHHLLPNMVQPPVTRSKLHSCIAKQLGLQEELRPSPAYAEYASDFQQRGHALVVDDNEINRQVLRRMLEHLNVTVTTVPDVKGALDALRITQFDVIFMDIHMPSVNGFEATAQIQQGLPNPPPIIAVTASSVTGQRERCLHSGMSDFLAKPVAIDELTELIDRWMEDVIPPNHHVMLHTAGEIPDIVLDETTLDDFFQPDTNPPIGHRLVTLFLDDLRRREKHFQPEHEELISSAHRLRSSAAVLGLHPLAQALGDIEDQCRSGHPPDAALIRLHELIPPSKLALEDYVAKAQLSEHNRA